MTKFTLEQYEITLADVRRNPSPAMLYEEAMRCEANSAIADSGALIAYSGATTVRSPQDKRIVWWEV